MYQIGIAGYGVVGKHVHGTFPAARVFDKYNGPKDDLTGCDFVFVCVPTPWTGKELDCSEVEAVVRDIQASVFVVRSTTYPGFIEHLSDKYGKQIVFQPEFIGESPNHSMSYLGQPNYIVLGGLPEVRRKVINLYSTVYNSNVSIRQMTSREAEVAKLTTNRAVFFKLMQMQELYDACEASGLDYYTIRDVVFGDDPRLDLGWSFVYPNNRGASSKCIPKDVVAWDAWASEVGADSVATKSLLKYNEYLLDKNKSPAPSE
jgi:UDPglucose 6-dehydrogenase